MLQETPSSMVALKVSGIRGVATSPGLIRLRHLQYWRVAPETIRDEGGNMMRHGLIPHPVKFIEDKKGPASFEQAEDLVG